MRGNTQDIGKNLVSLTRAMAERLGILYGSDANKAVALVRERAGRSRLHAVRRPASAAVLSPPAPGPT